jgi:hypothetical protein
MAQMTTLLTRADNGGRLCRACVNNSLMKEQMRFNQG